MSGDDEGKSAALVRSAGALIAEQRDRAIAILGDAFARGDLDMDEFEQRVTTAHNAFSPSEIEALTRDLDLAAPVAIAPRRETLPADRVAATDRVLCVLGGSSRRGVWSVPRRMQVKTIFGGAELDFREARLPSGPIDLEITAVFGGVHVIVPPGLAVEAQGSAILGGFEHVHRSAPNAEPGAPLLRIRGLAVLGGVQIEMRLPGAAAPWDDHRRRHRERRAQRRIDRHERRALRAHPEDPDDSDPEDS